MPQVTCVGGLYLTFWVELIERDELVLCPGYHLPARDEGASLVLSTSRFLGTKSCLCSLLWTTNRDRIHRVLWQ